MGMSAKTDQGHGTARNYLEKYLQSGDVQGDTAQAHANTNYPKELALLEYK